jgi:hypothetical protein
MEIALIAGVAFTGYMLRRYPNEKQEDEPGYNIVPSDADGPEYAPMDEMYSTREQITQHDELALKRFKDSFFPEKTGLVAPFYKIRSTATNDTQKQRRMEQFIGDDSTWRSKRENETLFDPVPQKIDSSGREGNNVEFDANFYKDSLTEKNQNTLPFEQIQVGRGLGVSTDTPAADGFHPMLRVMPADGLAHKSTEMGGRVNAGAVLNANRGVDPVLRHTKPPRVWDMSRRPLERAGAAHAEAQMHRGEHSSIDPLQCHVDGEYYTGVALRDGIYRGPADSTRTDDRTVNGSSLNIDGPKAPGGYHTYTPGDTARITSQHREKTVGPGPVAPVVRKESMYCSDAQLLKQAKRGTYTNPEYIAGPQRNDALLLAKLGYRVSPYMSQHHKMRAEMKSLENRKTSHPHSSAMINVPTQDVLGTSVPTKKLTGDTNPRNDFTLAKGALDGNPYVI